VEHPDLLAAAIRGDPRRSAAIRGDPRRSAAIRGIAARHGVGTPATARR
jgi:hypothetical protein